MCIWHQQWSVSLMCARQEMETTMDEVVHRVVQKRLRGSRRRQMVGWKTSLLCDWPVTCR